MGKESLAVLLLIVLVVLAIAMFVTGVEADEKGGIRLGLSLGASVILICLVLSLALYLGHIRTKGMYTVA